MENSTILQHYLAALLWSETDDHDNPLDTDHTLDNLAFEVITKSLTDIEQFTTEAGILLNGLSNEQIGHDLLLTRNGHGAGFWSRGLGQQGDDLTEIAKKLREIYTYIGDDGFIYIS